MINKLKPFIVTAIVVLVVLAIVGRVSALEKLVFPNG
jgi:hypothetical protein